MGRFKYAGRNRKGKTQGTINASSKREAMLKLQEEGIRVIEMKEVPETFLTKDLSFGGSSVKLQHFVIYLQQFSTLIKAGVTVVDATGIMVNQTESKALKKALLDVEQELREGNPLSAAVSKYKKIFTPMFVNMVKAGEVSGNLDETLDRLAIYFEKQHFTRQKIISALTYPAVVSMIAIASVIFLLVSVVPTFVSFFSDLHGQLPSLTKFVLSVSGFMQSYWWCVSFLILFLISLVLYVKQNPKTKYYFDYVFLKMPIFGSMIQKAALARMMRTLSSLFSSSVPILEAMTIVEKVVENDVIAKVIRDSRDSLERGRSMTEPMKVHWVFPPLVTQMIIIGEETGALDAMLAKIADFYEKEVETVTDRLKSLIEPIMIVLLASLVGTIVAAIVQPMFGMFTQFQQNG